MTCFFKCVVVVICLTSIGCGASHSLPADGIVVQGEVKWSGKPLVWGVVQLQKSDDIKVGASADVVDGKFSIQPERRLKPGTYKVMVFGGLRKEDNPEIAGPATSDQPNAYMVPAKHNHLSKLTVEIKEQGDNRLKLILD